MALIVDAYNVLHCTHTLPEPYATMSATDMCRVLDQSKFAQSKMTVVCDGLPKPDEGHYQGNVRLIYSGPGTDADSIIEELIGQDTGPRHLIVVSNDRRVIAAAKRRKAKALSAEKFLRELVADVTRLRDSPPKRDETDWLEEFGFDERGRDLEPPQPDQPG